MKNRELEQIFKDTDYVHWSGSPEELKAAEYLKGVCEGLGVKAELEAFKVDTAVVSEQKLYADGKEVACRALFGCGSGEIEGELYYMPDTDPVSIAGAKDKIVLLDTQGVGFFTYQDLMKAGTKGIIFRYGDVHYPNTDIDERDLRKAVVGEAGKVLCVMICARDAVRLVKNNTKRVRLVVKQEEKEADSHNVIAELPGTCDEWIALTAHYDTTRLSHGSYDNMSGCVGLIGIMDKLKGKKLHYGLRFIFCGSEERGLLGSKAYTEKHEAELGKIVLNINLDMIGTYMGKFISCVTAEDNLTGYIKYMAAELGFPVSAKAGVYSSDSTPFADKGVPAVSFARLAGGAIAPIHCRYDLRDTLSMNRMQEDIAFITAFTLRMANAATCPVSREIPEKLKTEIDEYLYRKRKDS